MDNGKIILYVLIGAVIGFLISWKGCGNRFIDNPQETVTHIDTVTYETVRDTTWYDTTRFKEIIVRVPVPYYDTTIVYESVYTQNDFDQLMRHPSIYEDSMIHDDTVHLKYRATVRGYLDKMELGYKIVSPFLIESNTILETEVTKVKRFNGFYLGLNAGSRLDSVGVASLTPMIELSWRNLSVEAGYDIVDGSIEIGVKRRISFRKNQVTIPRP